MTPCVITVAITGSTTSKKDNPATPILVPEQIESTHAAFDAGATIAHLHVRNDDGTPTADPDKFARLMEGIRKHCPGMIMQLSTGARTGEGKARAGMLPLKPEMATITPGSVNFATRVYANPPDINDMLCAEMKTYGVKPELEIFDLSMVFGAARLQKEGKVDASMHVQFVFDQGHALPSDRETYDFLLKTTKRLLPDATWGANCHGRQSMKVARWTLAAGGHCRTGLEDTVHMEDGSLAASNAALVKELAAACAQHGRRPATPAEARKIMGLTA